MKNVNNRYKTKSKKVLRPVKKKVNKSKRTIESGACMTGACSESFTDAILYGI